MTPPPAPGPLFSIIVPTHNRPEMLREALESLLRQTEPSWECIVVDDASSTPPALPADDRVRLIRLPRQSGPARCRNVGIDAAEGAYMCFLDDDDEFPPNRLEIDRGLLRDAPLLHWGGQIGNSSIQRWNRRTSHPRYLFSRTTPHLGTITVERRAAPRFDENFLACEDIDWLLRLTQHANLRVVPTVGWLWRRHDGPRGSVGAAARLQGSQLVLEKHAEFFRRHRSARAFRHYRMGLLARQIGDEAAARHNFMRSVRALPAPWVLLRSLRALMHRGSRNPAPAPEPQ